MVGEQRAVKENGGALFRHVHPHVRLRDLYQPLANRERIVEFDSISNGGWIAGGGRWWTW